MKLFIPKESEAAETRVPLLPTDGGKLVKLGAEVEVEAGIGEPINISDDTYKEAGAKISSDRRASMSSADVVLRMSVPAGEDIQHLKEGCIHISCLDPFNNLNLVKEIAARKVSAISLEMIPRTTIAQKMDVLSSQANLAGYVAVVLSAERQQKIFPMMMTAAGTIQPARVFVIGAGVAGLQAIATARRLGARVDAFDVRPEAQEQILSLGAKPLRVDLGETEKTKDGYAGQLSDEQIRQQREAMAKQCAQSDVVITTAKVFGKKAPLIVTNEMLDGMKPGSLVVDLAVETGGNVESSEPGKEIERKGVTIIGRPELQRMVPVPASQMFSSNLYNFMEHFWDKETKKFTLNRDDEIIQGCLITHEGEVVNPVIKKAIG
ncbi:MAG: NAD(P) transhydrogenase subunit alpha [Sedimentisphaerales bacterium]|nr:NAD(P) transhydrogenase subunit alpha [Sedimentisphaerales bacterium]